MNVNKPQLDIANTIIMASDISLSEHSLSDAEDQLNREENLVQYGMDEDQQFRREKRDREEDFVGVDDNNEGWNVVQSQGKRLKSQLKEDIEIYLSSNEKLPKQFALAKMLKACGIIDINKVKYINPFKIRVEVGSELSAEKIGKCPEFIEKGWKIYRAMERTSSYGVIKDVDLELSDEDILENITCDKPAEIISVFRLKRRVREGEGWQPSEAVQVCFKGSFIPQYIYVHGLRIKVTPYIFPVSQCSKCWKYGHPTKKCPSSKIICPKCGDSHENCETQNFKCVNCGGNHLALHKASCPAFLKEKRLREIMVEFNCTYRKALTIYVPPSNPVSGKSSSRELSGNPPTSIRPQPDFRSQQRDIPTFAEIVKADVIVHREDDDKNFPANTTPRFRRTRSRDKTSGNLEHPINSTTKEEVGGSESAVPSGEEKEKDSVNLDELLRRLKEILFLREMSMENKVNGAIKCCLEWLILLSVQFVSKWPLLKLIFEYFSSNGP